MTEDRLAELMVKVADGVATPAEREELMAHVVDRPELERELERHLALRALTDGWVDRLASDLVEDRHRTRTAPVARLGLALFVAGLAVLSGFGVAELLRDPEIPTWVRVGAGLLSAGLAVLLAHAAHWRLTTRSSDRYTEVIR